MWWVEAYEKAPGEPLIAEWKFPDLDEKLVAEVLEDPQAKYGVFPLTAETLARFGGSLHLPEPADFERYEYFLEYRSD
jgi:hypothetical protein